MTVIMMMASNRKVMGKFTIPLYLQAMGWLATGVMFCVFLGLLFTWR